MRIVSVPDPVLLQVCDPVIKVDHHLINFVTDLKMTLVNKKNPEGVGLSAPQVGTPIRIFCTYLDRGLGRQIEVFINPQIVKSSKKLTLGSNPKKPYLEGCLSIPEIYGPVWRHQRITIDYQVIDENTNALVSQTKSFDSFPARVIQHELDHLDGILFTKRALDQGLRLLKETESGLVEIDLTA